MIKIGSQGQEVIAWQAFIKRYASGYAKKFDGSPLSIDGYFGEDDLAVHNIWQDRSHKPRTKHISDDELRMMGLLKDIPPVKIAQERHLAVVFRGTGGVIGQDPVSRICQGASDLVEERNPVWSATMGGIPVGTAGGIGDPSMWRGVQTALAFGKKEIDDAISRNKKRRIIIGGYSAGACVAALLREYTKKQYPQNYLCGFSLGDPTRPFGASYYLGPKLAGTGISSTNIGDPEDYSMCWLTQPDDMYGNVPLGETGEIMKTAYDIVTKVELSDIIGTTKAIVPHILEIMEDSGIGLPVIFKGLTDGVLLGTTIPLLVGMLPGLIAGLGGNVNNPTGPAAAAQAAIIALRFMAAGTGPHIRYEFDEVWPGQTYVGLGIQHIRDWSIRANKGEA